MFPLAQPLEAARAPPGVRAPHFGNPWHRGWVQLLSYKRWCHRPFFWPFTKLSKLVWLVIIEVHPNSTYQWCIIRTNVFILLLNCSSLWMIVKFSWINSPILQQHPFSRAWPLVVRCVQERAPTCCSPTGMRSDASTWWRGTTARWCPPRRTL